MINGLTPREIVSELDKYIVGQEEAKRAVAIAIRNRQRRQMLEEEIQEEIYPKNIIMIGPTGVGKTEISRRLARLVDAPFYKVEASKFTEVGYVGRDVESMVRDLVEISVNRVRERRSDDMMEQAESLAEEKLLDQLVPPVSSRFGTDEEGLQEEQAAVRTREKFREKLRNGELEDRMIEPEIEESPVGGIQMHAIGMPMGMTGGLENFGNELKDALEGILPKKKNRKTVSVAEARPLLVQQELERLIDMDTVVREAVEQVEQSGIIFLDEIDKIVGADGGTGPDVSREGVQRDILPIVEGSTIFTKYGPIQTDHILFIAAGAFHGTKPSDLIPELQGRFPIRVELDALSQEDLRKILVEPRNSLIRQYSALLSTESVNLEFTEDAFDEISSMAARVNEDTENIGARRLHTIMEKLLEEISFDAPDHEGETIRIDADYVKDRLKGLVQDTDLSRFIL